MYLKHKAFWAVSLTFLIGLSFFADGLVLEDDSDQPNAVSKELEQGGNDARGGGLRPKAFSKIPLGQIKPDGWLLRQVVAQSETLTGYIEDAWPQLGDSTWKGGKNPGYYDEAAPCYLDGLIPLAYILDNAELKQRAQVFIEWIFKSQKPDGRFGPTDDHWPLSLALKDLIQYHEATKDHRVIDLMSAYFHYWATHQVDLPLDSLRNLRSVDLIGSAEWLYDQTGDPELLDVIDSIVLASYNWDPQFLDFPYKDRAVNEHLIPKNPIPMHRIAHGVSIALALKRPAFTYRRFGKEFEARAAAEGIRQLDRYHGQVGGRFSTDEHISGKNPSQGTELCAIVDMMHSMEADAEILGDPFFGDRLELLAFNSLPGAVMPDLHAHQYHSQANQIRVSKEGRQWHSGGDKSNLYGFICSYPCCLSNYHQGWPKFVSYLWMTTPEHGLAAIAYAPCNVHAVVGDGVECNLKVETDYPFNEDIKIRISLKETSRFPLLLRIPEWAKNAKVLINGSADTSNPVAGSYYTLTREWQDGDEILLRLPMSVWPEKRYNDAIAVRRGPLYFSLRMDEEFREIKIPPRIRNRNGVDVLTAGSIDYPGIVDWEIYSKTPWNVAVASKPEELSKKIKITLNPVPGLPFGDRGEPVYDKAKKSFDKITSDPAVILTLPARELDEWKEFRNSAAAPPVSPVVSDRPVKEIQLVPYGCARLRISEFPWTGE